MYFHSSSVAFVSIIAVISILLDQVSSTRSTQYCRHRGLNGNAEICLALNTFYNSTTDASDIYMTLQTYRYKSSKKGWAAMGLGDQMAGALMFIGYGNPETGEMTVSIRTATSHHPPGLITEKSYYDGPIPEIQVQSAKFEEYTGSYVNAKLGFGPTHAGTANIVCYDCKVWSGFEIQNTSTSAKMIWASNSQQDFNGDFTEYRGLEMHKMGLGFGPLWVDMRNAQVTGPKPYFPTIDERFFDGAVDKGVSEIGAAVPPPTDSDVDIEVDTAAVPDEDVKEDTKEETTPPPEDETLKTQAKSEAPPSPEQPARTMLGKTIRDWMWHLHGLCMTLAFLVLYPLGAFLIRTADARAFNFHWTTQAFASFIVFIGAVIGYWQSSSISVGHQFLGIAILLAISGQIVLGWQHHRKYVQIKRKTTMIRTHIWLGRAIFIAGFANIIMGLLLRRYKQWVIFLSCTVMIIEIVAMLYVLGRGEILRLSAPLGMRRDVDFGHGRGGSASGREAEEYFQLTGNEDGEDDLSEDGGDQRDLGKEEEKRDQARRLARLDRV